MKRDQTFQQMAEALNCTSAYIHQLRTGVRQTEHIGSDFAAAAARYLGVPSALVKLMSGRLTLADFEWPTRDPESDIAKCLNSLRDDPVIGCYVPKELADATASVKRFVWQLYSEYAHRHLSPKRLLPTPLEHLWRAARNGTDYDRLFADLSVANDEPDEAPGH
jgi:hypothetical protein